MHWLSVIGLNSFKGHLGAAAGYADKEGKVFPGYSGEYSYANIGSAEFVFHREVKGGRKKYIGFSSHVIGENIWEAEVSHEAPVVLEDDDRLCICPRFKGAVKGGARKPATLPIRLIHGDVLPCVSPNAVIKMQVAAFPYEVHYSPLTARWSEKTGHGLMATIIHAYGNIMGSMKEGQCSSVIEAMVRRIDKRETCGYDGEPVTFYAVTVDTAYGEIEICHSIDQVAEEEREFFKEGSCVFAWVVVQGDVAIDEYQEGAVYDEEHLLKLLQDAFENYDFSRAEYALSSHAIYSVAGQRIMGKWKVIDALKGMYGKKVYAHMGKQGDRPVLILADKKPSSFDRLIFIEVDGNNIKKITSTPELGTLSLTEGFSYRKDSAYIILEIMSDMIYEKDCSGLLNYLSEDVVYVDGDGETGGCYAVLRKLENLCEDKDGKRPDGYIVEATAPGEKYGKLALGLSFAGSDACHKVIFIRLEDGKITWIKADDNNYRIEELHKGYMGRVPNTAKGWLEYFRYWILGKPMPEEFFKDRMGSDCVLDMVNCGIMSKKTGKVVRHIEENDDIFWILTKLLFKPVIGHPCKVDGDALIGPQFRMTLECGARERMKPLYEKSSINEIKAIKFEAILPSKYH